MQDTCPFRGFRTRKANPVNLFRPSPPNSTAGGPFGASPVVTPLSGCTAAPDAGQEDGGNVAKGLPALLRTVNRQHNLEERLLPLHGLKMKRDSFPPSINPGTLTHLAGFPTERLHLAGQSPACRILCHRPGMMVKDRRQVTGCRLQVQRGTIHFFSRHANALHATLFAEAS